MEIRPYEPGDADGLWDCKRGFELGLGSSTGGEDKAAKYEGKLTESYRREWFDWVDRCRDDEPRCLTVAVDEHDGADDDHPRDGAVADDGAVAGESIDDGTGADDGTGDGTVAVEESSVDVVGYVFVLPDTMRFIWDSAVLNEIYVDPDYRGDGVGDDLMEAALGVAENQTLPLDRIVLDVDSENARAKAFYDRYGFESWGELVAREL